MALSLGRRLYNLTGRREAVGEGAFAPRPEGRLIWLHAPREGALQGLTHLANKLADEDGIATLVTGPREAGLMHLDRDDRGLAGDSIKVNGRDVVNPLNQEVVTIRGFAAGEYTVNAQYYESKNSEAVEATISVVKVNPRAEIVYYGTLRLDRKGDEATAVRFTVDPDGSVRDINTLPKQIVPQL